MLFHKHAVSVNKDDGLHYFNTVITEYMTRQNAATPSNEAQSLLSKIVMDLYFQACVFSSYICTTKGKIHFHNVFV